MLKLKLLSNSGKQWQYNVVYFLTLSRSLYLYIGTQVSSMAEQVIVISHQHQKLVGMASGIPAPSQGNERLNQYVPTTPQ